MSSSEIAESTAASSSVLDASALLALALQEPGAEIVSAALDQGAVISSVNLTEVVARLVREGWSDVAIGTRLGALSFQIEDFRADVAWRAGLLYRLTSPFGLSFGDRACLALALELGKPALTAEPSWARLDIGVEVVVCR
jgi:ribonuclease VapC